MAYKAKQVATEFIELAQADGKQLTPMQLQKLVYFAYGWYLAITGERLIDERVEAWKWGPVIPSLYSAFRKYGSGFIAEPPNEIYFDGPVAKLREYPLVSGDRQKDETARSIIKRVWEIYGKYSASQLSAMTHEPQSPWSRTEGKEVMGTDIPDDLIASYFRRLANNERPAAAVR